MEGQDRRSKTRTKKFTQIKNVKLFKIIQFRREKNIQTIKTEGENKVLLMKNLKKLSEAKVNSTKI